MVKFTSLLTASAFGLGALAHPHIKHMDRRFCSLEERSIFARTDDLVSRAEIPKATSWNPPSSMVTGLDQVWKQTTKENPNGLQDNNWIIDQFMANNGSLNYCVRWNNDKKITADTRASTAKALQSSMQQWFDLLVGYDGFPLTELKVNVVGYAVRDKSQFEGDSSDIDVYTTTDADGVPQCDPGCYRANHLDGDMSQCPGGKASRYDLSLWLDDSLGSDVGGYGYNWGQEISPDYFLNNIEQESIHILLHEMGHGFGLLDFYDWVPEGQTSFIMMAGSAMEITEFDAWMLRNWWRKLKPERNW